MKIRNKITFYFTSTVITLSAVSLLIIYFLFSAYREETFQQQQKEKIKFTIKQISKYKEMSENLAHIMDELTIHDFYDEKMMVFDADKKNIFSSIDDLTILQKEDVLKRLNKKNVWIETKEGDYDLIGIYLEEKNKEYFAISKAYDAVGYSKMYFLKTVLISMFFFITIIVILVSLYISNKISKPLRSLSEKINEFDLSSDSITELKAEDSSYELMLLTNRFNDLIKRTNETFAFQKHTTQHISHQLKTPIAILVSELERINTITKIDDIKPEIENQVIKAKSLGSIINVLLEISKIESGQKIKIQNFRADELIFDCMQELKIIYPTFNFEVNYTSNVTEEKRLTIKANETLIRQAFLNLMANCINYSNNQKSVINIDCSSNKTLKISFLNFGKQISKEEEKFLFLHFFRGENSINKTGFGLGLVLTKKIITLNSGNISYSSSTSRENIFEVQLPLS